VSVDIFIAQTIVYRLLLLFLILAVATMIGIYFLRNRTRSILAIVAFLSCQAAVITCLVLSTGARPVFDINDFRWAILYARSAELLSLIVLIYFNVNRLTGRRY